jgi:hypothetical protein
MRDEGGGCSPTLTLLGSARRSAFLSVPVLVSCRSYWKIAGGLTGIVGVDHKAAVVVVAHSNH